jgi:hypothetical protein
MRCLLFGAAVIVGVGFGSLVPATATPLAVSGLSSQSADATLVEDIGWRRQYRRYGYPVPYAYSSRVWVLCASTGLRLRSARARLLCASARRC